MSVTLVIPANNCAGTLERCLAAIQAQTLSPSRVVVIDDGSLDDTSGIAQAWGAEVVKNGRQQGLGVVRNMGLELCRTPFAAFLNADCYADSEWLKELLASVSEVGATAIGGRQIEGRTNTLAEQWKAMHLTQDWGLGPQLNPDYLSGGNFLVCIDKLGPLRFQEQYDIAYEDVDFFRRLRSHGHLLYYNPRAVTVHDHAELLRSLPKKVWSYGCKSRTVGAVHTLPTALRGLWRMHRRPHDPVRRALSSDCRSLRLKFVAIDALLLIASAIYFIKMGLGAANTRPLDTGGHRD